MIIRKQEVREPEGNPGINYLRAREPGLNGHQWSTSVTKVYCCVHQSPPPAHVLSNMNLICALKH
jgi:hypothetical protein